MNIRKTRCKYCKLRYKKRDIFKEAKICWSCFLDLNTIKPESEKFKGAEK